MKIGTLGINNCKIGNVQVSEIRIGSSLVWSSFDADAQLFITNAAITDPTQQTAVNNLVINLKGYGIWTKMKALYPFVGGTSTQHKFNLKNPLDTDAAFRLVFNGGFTHNSNGITGNGTNGYADTKLNENSILTLNNEHISLYVRNNVVNSNVTQMGVFMDVSSRFILNFNNSLNYSSLGQDQVGHTLNYPVKGFVALSKTVSTNCVYYQNGDSPVIKNGTAGKNNGNFFISALNAGSAIQYTNDNIAFASIGDGLSGADYTNLRAAVQEFQTTLSRNV